MNKPTEDSKIKKDEVNIDENTELTDEALEQVSGGVDTLKTKSGTVSEELTLNYRKFRVDYGE